MYLPVTHICFDHSETTRLPKPCAASHQPGQSNLRSGCWWMNGWWIQMGLGVCQYSDFCSKHKFFLKSWSQNTVFAFEKSVWTVELMASQVNRGTFCLLSAAEEPRSQAFTLVKQDELSLKVRGLSGPFSCGDSSRVASFPKQRVSTSWLLRKTCG